MAARRSTKKTTEAASGDTASASAAKVKPRASTKKSNAAGERLKLPEHISIVDGDTTHVSVINATDTRDMTRALLDAANDPSDVTTTTGPAGWNIPTTLAKKLKLA